MRKLNRHFSHPHALEPFGLENNDEGDFDDDEPIVCSGCEQHLSSPAFSCPKADCEFYLHKSCLELPRTLDHKSHLDHELALLSEPPRYSLYYDCNACGDLIKGFSFRCKKSCDFKLHAKCAVLPDTVGCKAHDHHRALAVRYCTPESGRSAFDMVLCDVCDGSVTEGYWSYQCEECDFVTHLECVFEAEVARPPVEEEEVEDEEEEEEEEEEVEMEDEEEEEEVEVEDEEEEEEEEVEVDDEEDEEEEEEEEEEEVEVEEEKEEEDEEEEEEEGLSDAMKLHRANMKAMNQMAILKFQMQMAEMNARATANLFRF